MAFFSDVSCFALICFNHTVVDCFKPKFVNKCLNYNFKVNRSGWFVRQLPLHDEKETKSCVFIWLGLACLFCSTRELDTFIFRPCTQNNVKTFI